MELLRSFYQFSRIKKLANVFLDISKIGFSWKKKYLHHSDENFFCNFKFEGDGDDDGDVDDDDDDGDDDDDRGKF